MVSSVNNNCHPLLPNILVPPTSLTRLLSDMPYMYFYSSSIGYQRFGRPQSEANKEHGKDLRLFRTRIFAKLFAIAGVGHRAPLILYLGGRYI